MNWIRKALPVALLAAACPLFAQQLQTQSWKDVGPYGGDARSLEYNPANPSHILLGTTDSWIYETDNGKDWTRLSRISPSDAMVVDNIVYDEANPKRVLVGAWQMDRPAGGIFISEDNGHTWHTVSDMWGQSVRALAQAPSNSRIFVAGTLQGVYRSEDGGQHWTLISPPGSQELHEVESIAIDPANPDIIYAGTWHLPWKTTDGGKNWFNIKNGLIVDSDVFSIIIDPHAPNVVYSSACSGIYKSVDAGNQFRKVQGIPSAARRTRVLKQDPNNPEVVYAGTTEGLYRTADGGTQWTLMTPRDIIVNDVYVDPKNSQHVILATDRSGIMVSEDGARTFSQQNHGFSERQVSALALDPQNGRTLYAGVVNDKRFGGVFRTEDFGGNWQQIAAGLDGNDIFSMAISPAGTLLAGTNHGVYELHGSTFEPVKEREREVIHKIVHYRKKRRIVTTESKWVPDGHIDEPVRSLMYSNGNWYAATDAGMYVSGEHDIAWRGGPIENHESFIGVAVNGDTVLANGGNLLYLSTDAGKSWHSVALPAGWSRVRYVTADATGTFWAGGRLGVAYSKDQGQSWQSLNVPTNNLSGLQYDAALHRVIASSYTIPFVYEIDPVADTWTWWEPGWRIHKVQSAGGRTAAATLIHGVLVNTGPSAGAGGN
jgi:photosystem II stability/assembly factor-like uncharacterized protein